ncbi:hypothetical protein [Pantoea sp.]|uniref:hypothetical protein n=1 Tax=Pantoea sp. TaxID=69393 RepID=UPI002910321A|nr:hypothetical protein [Pantoea sp.]MDU4127979.1 hypothetical protein [Pantoea sp.]
MNISSIVVIVITFITVVGAMVSTTVFQQIIAFAGGCFAVLVTIALTVSSALERLKPAAETKPEGSKGMSDAQIINAVTTMRGTGYNDTTIAEALNIDIAVIEAIPKAASL